MAGKLLVSDVEGQQGLLAAGTPAALHSLLSERTREVRALEDCHLLSVDAVELDRLLSWGQALQDVLLQLTMDGEETEWLERLLENPLFAQVPPQNIRGMLHRLVSVEAPAGQTLCVKARRGLLLFPQEWSRAGTQGRGQWRTALGGTRNRRLFRRSAAGRSSAQRQRGNDRGRQRAAPGPGRLFELLKAPVVSEVDLDEVADLLGCGAQWLDVRLADDYERGHAMQALHMLHLLRLKTRLLNPRRTYLCYCESGKRSASAVFLLTQLGFTAYALRGGLDALGSDDRAALLWECGTGYLARSDGRIERSL